MSDLDPERACVGIVMHDPRALLDMDLTPDDFRDPKLGALWGLITHMDHRGEAVTPTTVLAKAPTLGLPGIDGPFVFDCYQARPVTALAARYATIVANTGALRRLDDTARRIHQMCDARDIDAHEVAENARAWIDQAHRSTAQARLIGDGIDDTIDTLDQPTRAIPTPWVDLNRIIRGWRPGALYVIGARPGVGKTLIGMQAALGMCDHGHVAFNSLEMPEREIHARVIAQTARVALGRLDGSGDDAARLSQRDWDAITSVRPRLADLKLSIDDRASVGVMDVRSHARTLTRRGKLAGVVVDYLQLMATPRGDRRPRHEVVADFSRSLKLLAKELDVPVIALSQLNRAADSRQDRRPMLSDLRESGAVEQDADVVLLLHAPEPSSPDEVASPNMDIMVAKNRHGVVGSVELTRRGEFATAEARQWRPSQVVDQQPARPRRDLV